MMFGVDVLGKNSWVELTIGTASVVVASDTDDNFEVFNNRKYEPVAFSFDRDTPQVNVHGKCSKDHRHTTKPKPKPVK